MPPDNLILENPMTLYEMCVDLARRSPCQKRGFGSLLLLHGSIIAKAYNKPLTVATELGLCSPRCIRLDIKSGQSSMIGACGHSEEFVIWDGIRRYGCKDISDAQVFVHGVDAIGEPLVYDEPIFYCIRCATLMAFAGIAGVNVYVDKKWHFITADAAYESSLKYALGQLDA